MPEDEASSAAQERSREERSREENRPVQLAPEGTGPLFQRDYVGVIADTAATPEAVIRLIRQDFPDFSPTELAEFTRPDPASEILDLDDTMHVHIKGAGHCAVIVTLLEERSLTLRTLEGHLEAGRITFAADNDEVGRLVFRIRSVSRIRDPVRYLAYRLLGQHAQTLIWITFIQRVAERCGGRLVGDVVTSMDEVEDGPADWGEVEAPTLGA